jgi:hypothetical protein
MQGDVGYPAPADEREDSDRSQTRQTGAAAARGVVVGIEDLGVMRPVLLVEVVRSSVHWMRLLARGQARLLILKRHDIQQS